MMAAELSASCSEAAGGTVELDVHRLHSLLERYVRDHLAELAEIRPSLR
jgi:hypothetical protein